MQNFRQIFFLFVGSSFEETFFKNQAETKELWCPLRNTSMRRRSGCLKMGIWVDIWRAVFNEVGRCH